MAKKEGMPAWAIIEMRFINMEVGAKPEPPEIVYVQSHTVAYVMRDGRTFSHQLSKDCVPDNHDYDAAYLIGFADEPPFAAATISDEGVDEGDPES